MNNVIQETKEIMQLPESDVVRLLVNFKWDKMFLMDMWINSKENFLVDLSPSSDPSSLTSLDHPGIEKLEKSDKDQVKIQWTILNLKSPENNDVLY